MIRIYHKSTKSKKVEIIDEYKKGSWVYVEGPTPDEIETLVEKLTLEEGHLKDALDIHEVPRVETEDGAIYVFTRYAYLEDGQIETAPVLMILKKDILVTLMPQAFPRLEKLIDQKVMPPTTDKTKLLIALFSQLSMTFNDHLNSISKKVRGLTYNIDKIKNRDIILFVTYENVLNDFIIALVRTNNIIHGFLPGKMIKLNEREHDQLEDVSLYLGQQTQFANETLRTIVNLREAYSTIMTNNLNQVIKLFTSLTVVLTVPTIIASFFGMNVRLPEENNPYAFGEIILLTLVIVFAVLIIFKKRDYL